jgi:hypothetical protein
MLGAGKNSGEPTARWNPQFYGKLRFGSSLSIDLKGPHPQDIDVIGIIVDGKEHTKWRTKHYADRVCSRLTTIMRLPGEQAVNFLDRSVDFSPVVRLQPQFDQQI